MLSILSMDTLWNPQLTTGCPKRPHERKDLVGAFFEETPSFFVNFPQAKVQKFLRKGFFEAILNEE